MPDILRGAEGSQLQTQPEILRVCWDRDGHRVRSLALRRPQVQSRKATSTVPDFSREQVRVWLFDVVAIDANDEIEPWF